jgi:hypothetical protein
MSDFTSQAEAIRLGVVPAVVVKASSPSNCNVPGADFDVSKPVGSNHAAFPFGGMPH